MQGRNIFHVQKDTKIVVHILMRCGIVSTVEKRTVELGVDGAQRAHVRCESEHEDTRQHFVNTPSPWRGATESRLAGSKCGCGGAWADHRHVGLITSKLPYFFKTIGATIHRPGIQSTRQTHHEPCLLLRPHPRLRQRHGCHRYPNCVYGGRTSPMRTRV